MMGVFLALGESGFGPHRWDGKDLIPAQEEPTGIISPGLVDIHFHGAFGIDFMSASRQDMMILADRLEAEGYEDETCKALQPELKTAVLKNVAHTAQHVGQRHEPEKAQGRHDAAKLQKLGRQRGVGVSKLRQKG